jgi:hypothetical protein
MHQYYLCKQARKQAGTIGQFGIKERSKIDAC